MLSITLTEIAVIKVIYMTFDIYLIVLALVPIVVGILLGLMRGSRRSVLRLVLVLLCAVGAYFLKNIVAEKIMTVQIQGQTLTEIIINAISQISEQAASLGEVLVPIVQILITVVVFLLLFEVLLFLTWAIVFPLCKLFVKKGKKKHALVGGLVGAVQGVAVAFVLCVIVNGLLVNVDKVVVAMDNASNGNSEQATALILPSYNDGITIIASENTDGTQGDGGTGEQPPAGDGDMQQSMEQKKGLLTGYRESKIKTFLCKIGDKPFNLISTITVDDRKLTLSGQFDAISGMLKLASQENMELVNNLMNASDFKQSGSDIKKLFDALDEMNKGLPAEAKQTVSKVVQTLADSFIPADSPIQIDTSILDFEKVDFSKEGTVIEHLLDYSTKPINEFTTETVEDIVDNVMASDIVLPLLSAQTEFTLNLDQDKQDKVAEIIDNLAGKENAEQEKIDMLRTFFGLNDAAAN